MSCPDNYRGNFFFRMFASGKTPGQARGDIEKALNSSTGFKTASANMGLKDEVVYVILSSLASIS
jgi:hypothetical protein